MSEEATAVHDWAPKEYVDRGRVLEWGKSMSPEQLVAVRAGEVFTLLDADGLPYSTVLADSFNQMRERRIKS